MITKFIKTLVLLILLFVLVVPVMAQETPTPTSAATATPVPTVSPVPTPTPDLTAGLACISTAVGKRDDAISAAFTVFSGKISSLLSARKSALMAAWLLTDKKARRTAIKKAWNDFNTGAKSARRELNKARLAAWKTYKTDGKACRKLGAPTSDDYGSEGFESSL